jgi:hypothetical protein
MDEFCEVREFFLIKHYLLLTRYDLTLTSEFLFPSINIDYLLYLLLTPPSYFQRFSLEKNLFLPPFALFFIQQLLFIKTGT